MIFVTAGTTIPFDELFLEIDRLAGLGFFEEKVICQTGMFKGRLTHCEQFAFRPSIDDIIAESSMTISHGGATVIHLLLTAKPFVAFANPRGAGNHQAGALRRLAMVADLSWSSDVTDLAALVTARRLAGAATLSSAMPKVRDLVLAALK